MWLVNYFCHSFCYYEAQNKNKFFHQGTRKTNIFTSKISFGEIYFHKNSIWHWIFPSFFSDRAVILQCKKRETHTVSECYSRGCVTIGTFIRTQWMKHWLQLMKSDSLANVIPCRSRRKILWKSFFLSFHFDCYSPIKRLQ